MMLNKFLLALTLLVLVLSAVVFWPRPIEADYTHATWMNVRVLPGEHLPLLYRTGTGTVYWAMVSFRNQQPSDGLKVEFGLELDNLEFYGLCDSWWEVKNNCGLTKDAPLNNLPYLVTELPNALNEIKWVIPMGEGRRYYASLKVYVDNMTEHPVYFWGGIIYRPD